MYLMYNEINGLGLAPAFKWTIINCCILFYHYATSATGYACDELVMRRVGHAASWSCDELFMRRVGKRRDVAVEFSCDESSRDEYS